MAQLTDLEFIGIAVRNLEAAIDHYVTNFGGVLLPHEREPEWARREGMRVANVMVGGVMIQLMEPSTETSPVARFLQRRGEGVFSLRFNVPDGKAALKEWQDKGLQVIPGTETYDFIHPKSNFGVLLEFGSKTGQ
jgi:methylmalonyl-CoA/ethylmalonyl-CoA epimerase